MGTSLLDNLNKRPDAARALRNYRRLAEGYDSTCNRIEGLRLRAVRELALQPGETVLDVACGTGATLPMLAAAVRPGGSVIGVEMSPQMAMRARSRVSAAGLDGIVDVIETSVEWLHVPEPADALFLSYTHDVLQSPAAVDRLLSAATPGARIVVLGMKTLPWLWGWPANLFNLYRARHYMTTYSNLRRPWHLLEQRGASLREVHTALWGSAYIASGALPPGDSRHLVYRKNGSAPADALPTQQERHCYL